MNLGIVGHEAAKFTPETEAKARAVINELLDVLCAPLDAVVSGRCHLGGIDVWAEEEAEKRGIPTLIFPPKTRRWNDGYKPRNLLIADRSDVVHVLVVAAYPPGYAGMRFEYCYHCQTREHIKSGGCWTAKRATKAVWHVI